MQLNVSFITLHSVNVSLLRSSLNLISLADIRFFGLTCTSAQIVFRLGPIITRSSRLNSIAGETTLFANPVIGTMLPAPAYLPILSYTPTPVSSADRKIRQMLAAVPELLFPQCSTQAKKSVIPCPTMQITPPTQNARQIPRAMSLLGDSLSTSCA